MAEKNRKSARASQRRQAAAKQLFIVGMLLLLLPVIIPAPAIKSWLGAFQIFGFVALVLGCIGLLLAQERQGKQSPSAKKPWYSSGAESALPVQVDAPIVPVALPELPDPADFVGLVSDRAREQMAQRRVDAGFAPETAEWSKSVLEEIEWRRFEAVVETLFQQMGFETQSQSHGADGGVDVWLYSRLDRSKAMSLVQCKHWHGTRAGVNLVRELRGVMASHGVGNGQFVCSGGFTPDAVAFARDNSIRLLDAQALLDLIAKRSPEQQQALMQVALEGEYWRPTCASCGIKLVERKPRKGGVPFWGCANYPRCKSTLPIRARSIAGF